jgi:hypothetical protein
VTFIAIVGVALDPTTAAPVAVAVITSYLLVSVVRYGISKRRSEKSEAVAETG